MKPTLIFADAHLKVTPAEKPALDDFVRFIRSFDDTPLERVVILGDLFDFWFEYRHAIFSGYFEALRALAQMRDRVPEMHLICGNHDFWAGRFFEEELGITVHPDSYRCDLFGRDALFVHGDGINPEDRAYRMYKKFARSRLAIGTFRLIHPDWAIRIAQSLSHSSRALLSPKDPSQSGETKALRKFGENTLRQGEADIVFCGHAHYPLEETFPTPRGEGLYVNTGDWQAHRSYLIANGDTLERLAFGEPRTDIWPASKQERTIRLPSPVPQQEAREARAEGHQ